LPQLFSVLTLVSQPLFGSPSQLSYPAEQVGTHTLFWHLVVPFGFVHVMPHAPQLLTVFSATSQPLEARLSQLA
jgi:hypothetical protein